MGHIAICEFVDYGDGEAGFYAPYMVLAADKETKGETGVF